VTKPHPDPFVLDFAPLMRDLRHAAAITAFIGGPEGERDREMSGERGRHTRSMTLEKEG